MQKTPRKVTVYGWWARVGDGSTLRPKQKVWRSVWISAIKNMPYKIMKAGEGWYPLPPGTTPIAEFHEGCLKGTHRLVDGHPHIKTLGVKRYGQTAMLARLLGKHKPNRRHSSMYVYTATQNGSKPREHDKAELLMKLANPDTGATFAWQLASDSKLLTRFHYKATRS